nr:collagen alpha-1(III) chain-like [Peromyscus maniculatus bairdii]
MNRSSLRQRPRDRRVGSEGPGFRLLRPGDRVSPELRVTRPERLCSGTRAVGRPVTAARTRRPRGDPATLYIKGDSGRGDRVSLCGSDPPGPHLGRGCSGHQIGALVVFLRQCSEAGRGLRAWNRGLRAGGGGGGVRARVGDRARPQHWGAGGSPGPGVPQPPQGRGLQPRRVRRGVGTRCQLSPALSGQSTGQFQGDTRAGAATRSPHRGFRGRREGRAGTTAAFPPPGLTPRAQDRGPGSAWPGRGVSPRPLPCAPRVTGTQGADTCSALAAGPAGRPFRNLRPARPPSPLPSPSPGTVCPAGSRGAGEGAAGLWLQDTLSPPPPARCSRARRAPTPDLRSRAALTPPDPRLFLFLFAFETVSCSPGWPRTLIALPPPVSAGCTVCAPRVPGRHSAHRAPALTPPPRL